MCFSYLKFKSYAFRGGVFALDYVSRNYKSKREKKNPKSREGIKPVIHVSAISFGMNDDDSIGSGRIGSNADWQRKQTCSQKKCVST